MIAQLSPNSADGREIMYTKDRSKLNEVIDAVNDLQALVHEGPDDFMEDLDDEDDCCACDDDDNRAWKETDPFVERLHHLSTSQLEHLLEEAEWILEGRHRQDQTGMCPDCQDQAEAEDDGYDGCCQCNCDCHDLPDDDDEDVTEEIQKVVDDVRGKNAPREIDTTDVSSVKGKCAPMAIRSAD